MLSIIFTSFIEVCLQISPVIYFSCFERVWRGIYVSALKQNISLTKFSGQIPFAPPSTGQHLPISLLAMDDWMHLTPDPPGSLFFGLTAGGQRLVTFVCFYLDL